MMWIQVGEGDVKSKMEAFWICLVGPWGKFSD